MLGITLQKLSGWQNWGKERRNLSIRISNSWHISNHCLVGLEWAHDHFFWVSVLMFMVVIHIRHHTGEPIHRVVLLRYDVIIRIFLHEGSDNFFWGGGLTSLGFPPGLLGWAASWPSDQLSAAHSTDRIVCFGLLLEVCHELLIIHVIKIVIIYI